jgi:predicted transcriptional regulator
MAAAGIHLTDAEFAVLEPLWRDGPQTIRQLTAVLYPQQTVSDYATVQKLLERLEAKRCVRRDRSKQAHVFRAAVEREQLIDERLKEIAERLCGGSLVPVLSQLVRRVRLSTAERDELRKLIEAAQKPKRGGEQ